MRTLTRAGMDLYNVREEVLAIGKEREASQQKKELPFLSEYARDLTYLAAQGTFDPLIGRSDEVDRIIQVLSRRTKNNPILLGEPGVGKTAIVEGLAQRIVEGRVPISLAQRKMLALDLSLIVAGTKYRGQFEERLKGILTELQDNPDVIVFIDEIHSLIGAGSAEGLAGCRKHPQAGFVARRCGLYRCDDAEGVPQVHREGSIPPAPVSVGADRTADRSRRPSRSSKGSRIATRRFTRCATRKTHCRRPSISRPATSRIGNSPTRPST